MYLDGKNNLCRSNALRLCYMHEHNRTFDLVIHVFACVVFGIDLYYTSKLSQRLRCDLLFRQPGKLNIQSSLTEKYIINLSGMERVSYTCNYENNCVPYLRHVFLKRKAPLNQ